MLRVDRGGWPYEHPPNGDFILNTLSPQARGLVAWYPLGLGQYRWRNVLGRHHLSPLGGPTLRGSRRGLVTLFDDAASQRLSATGAIVLAPPFTISAWINTDALLSSQAIAGVFDAAYADYHYLMISSARAYARSRVGAGADVAASTTTTMPAANAWYHVCGIWAATDSRAVCLNANGKGTNANDVAPSGLVYSIVGARGVGLFMSGMIADVRFYNRALSDVEIKQLYRNPWELCQPVVRR